MVLPVKKTPLVMGILNVTLDSFFDGGKTFRVDSALKQAEKMVREGADILDVGGESSRPGAQPVSVQEECMRVIPVIKRLVKLFPKVPISVDTQKSTVADQSLNEGAQIINDISALRADKKMIGVIERLKPYLILMHMRGTPQTMQKKPKYKNVVKEVRQFLSDRIQWACERGLNRNKIWIDPGIGFGKTVPHNLSLLKQLKNFCSLGCPVLIGVSRKSFIGTLLGEEGNTAPPEKRLEGSLAAACWSVLQGAAILRVHDVGATRNAIRILEAVRQAR